MRVWVYPENVYEELGAERWLVSWEQLTKTAAARLKGTRPDQESEEFEYDRDLLHCSQSFPAHGEAQRFARKLVSGGRTFFGAATIMRQTVDMFVDEDRTAEWADAGVSEEVS